MENFISSFSVVDDPHAGNVWHSLLEILFIVLAAVPWRQKVTRYGRFRAGQRACVTAGAQDSQPRHVQPGIPTARPSAHVLEDLFDRKFLDP